MDQYGRDREVKEGVDGLTWDSLGSILHNLKFLHRRDYKPAVTNTSHQQPPGGTTRNNGGDVMGGNGNGNGGFPNNAGQGMSNQGGK